jgi:membrane-associated phospholipid phosphatase
MASSGIGAPPAARRRRDAARLLLAWTLLVAVVLLVGAALTGPLAGTVGVADNDFERSLAAHRSAGLSGAAQGASLLGETTTQLALVPVLLLVVWWWLRKARPVVFLAVVAAGELSAYLLTVSIVSRPRPPVPLLDAGLEPLHSYPSGHVAAAMATYGGMAVLCWTFGTGPWRRLSTVLLVAPPAVAVARLYLGVHHPTDVLVSLVFMAAWLAVAAAVLLVPPPRESGSPVGVRGRPRDDLLDHG